MQRVSQNGNMHSQEFSRHKTVNSSRCSCAFGAPMTTQGIPDALEPPESPVVSWCAGKMPACYFLRFGCIFKIIAERAGMYSFSHPSPS